MLHHKPRLQHLGQPSEPGTLLTKPPMSPLMTPSLTLPNQPLSLALPMPSLTGVTHHQPTWSSGSPLMLSPLSLRTKKKIKALMTFSLLPNTAAPSHVSTEPQCSKNEHQKSKTFHLKPKSHASLTEKHFPNVGMRSSHSFKKNRLSPIANANGTFFNSYIKKNYDRNCQSSLDAYNLAISHNYVELSRCTTPTLCTFFTHTYAPLPTLCTKTLATPLLPCFHKQNVRHSSATMQFSYLTARPTWHVIQKPPMHGHQNISQISFTLLIFLVLAFTMLN